MYHSFYARLAASIPIAGIVSIALPLAPENPLPAAIAAGYTALDWLKSLACPVLPNEPVPEPTSDPINRLRDMADLSRVFLIGDSTGANLVHHVAAGFSSAEPGYWGHVRLAGAILLNPGFTRSTPSRSESTDPVNRYMSRELVGRFMALALPEGATRDHPVNRFMALALKRKEVN
jgi:acetyl esterase/lipase